MWISLSSLYSFSLAKQSDKTEIADSFKEKISVYNLSLQNISDGEIKLLRMETKHVHVTIVSAEQTKIDILSFSRKLLLKYSFHAVENTTEDIIIH